MLNGFKDFLFRGNIVDLAVAVVIGTAFVALVDAFTTAFINPIINLVQPGDASGFAVHIGSGQYLNFGLIITAIISFVITAAVVYFVFVVPSQKLMAKVNGPAEEAEEAPAEEVVLLREIRDALAAKGGSSAL